MHQLIKIDIIEKFAVMKFNLKNISNPRVRAKIRLFIAIAIGIYVIVQGVYSSIRASKATDPEVSETSITDKMQEKEMKHSAINFKDLLYVKLPTTIPSQEKEYEGFKVSFNRETHTPNWVAWELLGSELKGEKGRSNNFWQDPEMEGCPTTNDYKRSGYDRGHLCPAADQKWSAKAMEDCFVMANICPQDHALNSGAWNTLENKTRNWAKRDSALIIIAGPIFEKKDTLHIGKAGVRVPGAFFKVIAAPYLEKPRGIAFIYPNMTSPGNMQNYVMTIDDLEQLTGYDFLSSLPDDLENEIESTTSYKEWNRSK